MKRRVADFRISSRRAIALIGGTGLAGLAAHALRHHFPPWDSAVFLIGALALFLWGARPEEVEAPWPASVGEQPLSSQQWYIIGGAFFFGVLSWFTFSENCLSRPGLLWLALSIAAIFIAAWPRETSPRPRPRDLLPPRLRLPALLGIVLLGAVFRLYLLDSLPSDMFNDLTYNYRETEQILRGEWMIYATGFPGREPLLFYLTALLSQLAGLNFYTLKLITALIGTATLPVVYLLGREAYSDLVGLVAALLLAVAKWHVLISRVGFRGILTPLMVALVALFLLRGLRSGHRSDFLWAGFFLGLSLYTYTAALALFPATLLGLALYALAGHARDLWQVRRSLLLACLVALLVALPMLRYMLVDGREQFWFRPLTRVGEIEESYPGPLWEILLSNIVRTAGMFHVRGDVVFRVNVPEDPHLDGVAGALFLLGLPLLLARWRRGGNAPVLAFFAVMLLPTTLALAFPREVPGAVRSGGAMATVMLFPAVAAAALWERLGRIFPALRSRWGWGGLLAVLALASGLPNARLCFVEYPKFLPAGNYPLYREIARVIDEFGDDGPVYLKSVPFWDDKDAIRLQTREHHEWGLHGEVLTEIDRAFFAAQGAGQGAVILNPEADRASLWLLQEMFPHGLTVYYRDDQGRPQFAVFLYRQDDFVP
ncbi:MAG: glycosyltransferase family 39 protein [Chloroflexia bacterium]